MRPLEALSYIMKDAGQNGASLARQLGKSSTYVRNYFNRGIIPSVDNYNAALDKCGWDLLARSRKTGQEITITDENEDSLESYLE